MNKKFTEIEKEQEKTKKRYKNPYFVDSYLMKKVKEVKAGGCKKRIKTWSRRSTIYPEFVDCTFEVHNGRTFIPVFIKDSMIGHKLGEFAPTRTFKKHPGNNAEDKARVAAAASSGDKKK